ncbi:hypothetical protein [Fulvivirga aurantia]|uniref:hypothetical protein n=1 Tax=Fulvivirga aurantia TaxID=2529383 RepID=UPI0012BCFB88|nr:hypothetical protein [Fulvivirga aurantia]
MKSKITILIAVFAVAISFAFITVNKTTYRDNQAKIEKPSEEPLKAYAMEDSEQWN